MPCSKLRGIIACMCHQFTVDDLNHIHRGGRVSRTVAVVGTLMNIKPVLHLDDEGKLSSTGIKQFLINYVGPVIGSHSGPGTAALFFVGKKR